MGISIPKDIYHIILWQFDQNYVYVDGELLVFAGDVMAARALRELHTESKNAIDLFDIRNVTNCRFGSETKRGSKSLRKTISLNTQFAWKDLHKMAAYDVIGCMKREYSRETFSLTPSFGSIVMSCLESMLDADPTAVFNIRMMGKMLEVCKLAFTTLRHNFISECYTYRMGNKTTVRHGYTSATMILEGREFYPHQQFDGDHIAYPRHYMRFSRGIIEPSYDYGSSFDYESLYPTLMRSVRSISFRPYDVAGIMDVAQSPEDEKVGLIKHEFIKHDGEYIFNGEPHILGAAPLIAPLKALRPAIAPVSMRPSKKPKRYHRAPKYTNMRAQSKPKQHKQKHR